jgi:hypothetical protein
MEPLKYAGTSSTATGIPLGRICTGASNSNPISGTDLRLFSSDITASPNTVSFNTPITFTQSTSKQIMQNKVAIFKVTRDEFETITKTEFIKELWVETKNGQSVDFQVARDKDLADYEMSDLSIRTIFSLTF